MGRSLRSPAVPRRAPSSTSTRPRERCWSTRRLLTSPVVRGKALPTATTKKRNQQSRRSKWRRSRSRVRRRRRKRKTKRLSKSLSRRQWTQVQSRLKRKSGRRKRKRRKRRRQNEVNEPVFLTSAVCFLQLIFRLEEIKVA